MTGPQKLSPRVRTMWHLSASLVAGPLTIVAVVAGLIGAFEGLAVIVAVAAVVAIVAIAAAILGPRLRYERFRWELTGDGLQISHGVLLRVQSAIPVFRVQQIDVRQGPVERWFGLVTLHIATASSGSDGTLPGIAAERADDLRRELMARVSADDGV